MEFIKKLIHFGILQVLCCIFPGAIFLTLAISKLIHIPVLPRYDFIFIICVIIQIMMVKCNLETMDELKVICLFHIIGLVLELYKVRMGSWSYPEFSYFNIFGVPLYSGFMYASVASYICQAWKRFKLMFVRWPKDVYTYLTAIFIYLNFFTHHFIYDFRWILIISLFATFGKSYVNFTVGDKRYKMPIILSYFLIGFFIWVAENISTFLGAWKYPDQLNTWKLVHIGKISSWFLLVIISIILVVNLKKLKYGKSIQEINKPTYDIP